jgi:hypothetical protein
MMSQPSKQTKTEGVSSLEISNKVNPKRSIQQENKGGISDFQTLYSASGIYLILRI